MKNLSILQMEQVTAQGKKEFCTALYVGESVYAVGVVANFWNPVGWGGTIALIGLNGYCVFG